MFLMTFIYNKNNPVQTAEAIAHRTTVVKQWAESMDQLRYQLVFKKKDDDNEEQEGDQEEEEEVANTAHSFLS